MVKGTRHVVIFSAVAIVALLVIGTTKTLAENNFRIPLGEKESVAERADQEESGTGAEKKMELDGEGYQKAVLRMVSYRYVVEPDPLMKGIPVKMEVDLSTVYGCMRTVVIPAFGVNKRTGKGDNIIEFTPDKSGTFQITCGMNMGRGSFRVAEESGTVSDYKDEPLTAGSGIGESCGGGSGGSCGCGG